MNMRARLLWIPLATAAFGPALGAERVARTLYNERNFLVIEDKDEKKKPEGKIYVGARFGYTLASFDNKYSFRDKLYKNETDSFSMKPQMGFDAAAGYQFAPLWRAEFNYADSGKFEDKDAGASFDIQTRALTLNVLYTIWQFGTTSTFAGAGAGVGMLTTKFSGHHGFALNAQTEKSSAGFAGNLQLGIEEKITDSVRIGLTYKLGYITGHTQEILLTDDDVLTVKNEKIINNAVGLGIRLSF